MISVIIPAYNEEEYIEQTLKALKQQTFTNFETIVVCNGCTDKTAQIAKKYTSKVFEIEKGLTNAKNLGAQKARNETLFFIDADTIPSRNVLKEIAKNKNYIGTCNGKPDKKNLRFLFLYFIKNSFARIFKLSSGCFFCPKELFEEINGYDNTYPLEHRNMMKKLKNKKYKILKTPVTTSMRRYGKKGVTKATAELITNMFKKEKHHEEIR